MSLQTVDFGPIEVSYDSEVLEPRPWTIEQSRWSVELYASLDPAEPVLELCAGAGQIGLVLAHETGCLLVQVDSDERACHFARHNARANDLEADVRCASLEDALAPEERFRLVLADPPYIRSEDTGRYAEDPAHTIDGGEDGLDLARTCLTVTAGHLLEGGHVLIQLGGPEQAAELSAEAETFGLEAVETRIHGADRSLLLLRRAR